MECAREGCTCPMGEARVEVDGKVYCCEKCATVCTDGSCQCQPGECASR